MAAVVGLGGIFYKAADQAAVKDWYARVLGVKFTDWGGAMFPHPKIGKTQVASCSQRIRTTSSHRPSPL